MKNPKKGESYAEMYPEITAEVIQRLLKESPRLTPECSNCQGQSIETGYVELWDGVCPECGRLVEAPQ
jgi:hypothetical protein